MTIDTLMQKASAAIMLVALVTGKPVFADTSSVNISAPAETTAVAVPAPTVQDVLLSVCEENGYGQDCAQTLLGMLWTESNNVSTAVGDHGLALGYFQIHYKLHGITTDCATDIVCSANWTIGYLEKHSYPTYVSYAVQCHNSCNAGNGYAARALKNGARLWDQPLTVTQAAPVDLSQLDAQLAMK